jgi:hypothetical protein
LYLFGDKKINSQEKTYYIRVYYIILLLCGNANTIYTYIHILYQFQPEFLSQVQSLCIIFLYTLINFDLDSLHGFNFLRLGFCIFYYFRTSYLSCSFVFFYCLRYLNFFFQSFPILYLFADVIFVFSIFNQCSFRSVLYRKFRTRRSVLCSYHRPKFRFIILCYLNFRSILIHTRRRKRLSINIKKRFCSSEVVFVSVKHDSRTFVIGDTFLVTRFRKILPDF